MIPEDMIAMLTTIVCITLVFATGWVWLAVIILAPVLVATSADIGPYVFMIVVLIYYVVPHGKESTAEGDNNQ